MEQANFKHLYNFIEIKALQGLGCFQSRQLQNLVKYCIDSLLVIEEPSSDVVFKDLGKKHFAVVPEFIFGRVVMKL